MHLAKSKGMYLVDEEAKEITLFKDTTIADLIDFVKRLDPIYKKWTIHVHIRTISEPVNSIDKQGEGMIAVDEVNSNIIGFKIKE